MKFIIKLFLYPAIFFLGIVISTGQGNPAFEDILLLENSIFQKSISGYNLGKTHAPQHGDFVKTGNPGNYTLKYVPDSAYIGTDTLIVEYWKNWRRRGTHYYESYVFEIMQSIVLPKTDFYTIGMNDSAVVMTVLGNDSTSIGETHVEFLPNTNGGNAIVLPDGTIEFTPKTDFVGMAYINYVACDSLGACGNGLVMISVIDSGVEVVDTINLIMDVNMSTNYGLMLEDMTLVDTQKNGTVNFISTSIIEFVPDTDFSGRDTFYMESSDNDASTLFYVEVLDKPKANGVLVDDVIQCAMNNDISFDVLANDVTDNYKVKITKYPSQGTLIHDTLGEYTYTPPSDYQGIQYFEYELKYSDIGERAEVAIYINDGHPQNDRVYHVYSPYRNVPYILNYDIPIKKFDKFYVDSLGFVLSKLDIYEGDTALSLGYCSGITEGEDLVIFTPAYNNLSNHYIRLKHCIGDSISGDCELIEIIYHITSTTKASCACINDCVWQGDINYDGKVNMKDLLSLGYLIGESGPTRLKSDAEWVPQSSSSWGQKILGSNRDIKHADTDGNGIISSSDTTAIANFYYKEHSMEPELVGPERDFPFYLIPLFDSVKVGDLAVYEIALGDEIDPAYDLHGFAYTLTFGFDYDSSTLKVKPIPSTWFTGNSGFLDLAKQPFYQHVDGGMTRTSGNLASGMGSVETLEFIVEEDIEGFKYGKNRYALTINGSGVGATGEGFKLPGHTVNLPMSKPSKKIRLNPADMLIYPNPTADIINLHLNGGNIMNEAYIYDINGKYINEVQLESPVHSAVDLSHLNNGIYIIKINTPLGPIAKKLEVVR